MLDQVKNTEDTDDAKDEDGLEDRAVRAQTALAIVELEDNLDVERQKCQNID